MFQRFYTNNIESKFIKALLHNTPLCNLQSVQDGDYIIQGFLYTYQDMIIKCVKSGYLGVKIISNQNNEAEYALPIALYKMIQHYELGQSVPKLTSEYFSATSYYDVKTHIKLGQLLRDISNLWGINLMPFYNLYCPNYFNGSNTNIIVPINYDKKYTIALNCPIEIIIQPIFYDGVKELSKISGIDLSSLSQFKARRVYGASFTQPFLFEMPNTESATLYNQRKNLYLKLTIPEKYQNSVVILEGDFTTNPYRVFNAEDDFLHLFTDKKVNELLMSKPSLLTITDGNTNAFSDTLIQYLLKNVITDRDEFGKNVLRVQKYLKNDNELLTTQQINLQNIDQSSIWSLKLRMTLYELYMNNYLNQRDSNYQQRDINGFVDKSVENYIRKTTDTISPQQIDEEVFTPEYDWIR